MGEVDLVFLFVCVCVCVCVCACACATKFFTDLSAKLFDNHSTKFSLVNSSPVLAGAIVS